MIVTLIYSCYSLTCSKFILSNTKIINIVMPVLPSYFLGTSYSVNIFFSLFISLTEMRIFKVSRAYFQTAIENDSFILTSVSLNLKRAAERTKNGTQMKKTKTKHYKKFLFFIVVKQNARKRKNKNKKLYVEQHNSILNDTIVCVLVLMLLFITNQF